MIKWASDKIKWVFGKKVGTKIVKFIDKTIDGGFVGWVLKKVALYIRKVIEFLNTILGQTGKIMVTAITGYVVWLINYSYFKAIEVDKLTYLVALSGVETLVIAVLGIFTIVVTIGITAKKVINKDKKEEPKKIIKEERPVQ